MTFTCIMGLLINFGSYKFEIRKFAWSQAGASRKSKPTFLLSALFAFFALPSSNLLASGEDLARGTVVTEIKPRNTRNTRKRNGKRFPCRLPCISRIQRLLLALRLRLVAL